MARNNQDPAGVNSIIKRFERQLLKRMEWLKKEIKKFLPGLLKTNPLQVFAVTPYDFATSSNKVEAFMNWLNEMEEKGVLTSSIGPGQSQVGYQHWTDIYVEASYKKGMEDAYSYGKYSSITGLSAEQWIAASLYTAIHADRLGLLYTRTFNDLKGITDAMDASLSRVLAQGMAEGKNPAAIAKDMVEAVDGIGIKRARLLSRTEIMRAHAEAALNSYESFNEEGLTIKVEWSASTDGRTCPACLSMAYENGKQKVYTLEQARGLIPLHPNCRCVWIPIN